LLTTKDTRIIYKNELGGEIEFSPFSVFYLEQFEEETKNNIVTNKTNMIHGNNFISSSLDSRYITISGIIEKNAITEVLTNKLLKTINPTLSGKLFYTNKTENKEIDCRVEEIPIVVSNSGLIKFEIGLVALNPFWKNKEKVEYISLLTPQLKFPIAIPKKGICFGRRKSILETEVNNIGDVESGFRVLFKAKSSVTNPKIFNVLTGEYIKINYEMAKGDSIEVVNYPEKKSITINSIVNGFKYLDINSDFFTLEVGKNKIGYIADINTINLDVILYYTPRFLGV